MAVVAEHLRLGYGDRQVVDGLDLTVEPGRITCLVGPNGCGKSTMLHGLSRLLAPQGGLLTLDGRSVRDWPGKAFARRVAVLPQNPAAPEGLTVRDLVGYGRHPHRPIVGRGDSGGGAAIDEAIAATDLVALAHRPVSDLSGGERQRAWIAMALAQQAGTLLLDEPTTFLDIRHQLDLMDLLQRLNRQKGLTLVVSLHDLAQAARYADRLIAISDGRIAVDGPPRDVLDARMLDAVFGIEARIFWDGDLPICLPLRTAGRLRSPDPMDRTAAERAPPS